VAGFAKHGRTRSPAEEARSTAVVCSASLSRRHRWRTSAGRKAGLHHTTWRAPSCSNRAVVSGTSGSPQGYKRARCALQRPSSGHHALLRPRFRPARRCGARERPAPRWARPRKYAPDGASAQGVYEVAPAVLAGLIMIYVTDRAQPERAAQRQEWHGAPSDKHRLLLQPGDSLALTCARSSGSDLF
jgi:hypothetical protein